MSAQEQVNFLLACIKHSQTGGKVDFEAVATELNIKTKAAAAKRYERLKKRALGSDLATTSAGGDGDENGSPFATPQKSRTKATTSGPETPGSTKRKRSGSNDQADSDGDDLGAAAETPSGRAKTAKARTPRAKRQQAQKAAEAIKQEAEAEAAEDVAEREGQLARENTGADEDEVRDDVIEVQLEARDMVEDADGF